MKNKSIIAKLLAEEDIFVVYKKMETAYFNAKTRELGLPIWNDELMTPSIEDLMVCHEIAHAIWTPLDMLEQAQVRKINHSFVNIIEDARIERMVQERYRGSVAVFNRGYRDLTEQDFFGIADKEVSDLNLIDRINLFFKKQKVEFSDEEKVWVKKVSECETPDNVLDLAEELYKWMEENAPEEQEENSDSNPMESNSSDETDDMKADTSSSESSEEGEEELAASNSGSADDKSDDGESADDESGGGESDGGESEETSNDETEETSDEKTSTASAGNGSGGSGKITASTDTDINNAIKRLIDENATDRIYANIPNLSGDDVIVKYNEIIKTAQNHYYNNNATEDRFYLRTREVVETMKSDSKKTVSYMVKEFEMKKSADQYARAAVSKSGSLDMNRLHTYKYNDDIFKKVTTLPGATNHGMVMVVDWSGSMYENLTGTLSQLYNLIWFCRRTQIPFEVYAFSNSDYVLRTDEDKFGNRNLLPFKSGDLMLNNMKLLNFFSNRMTVEEEMNMMHFLWMAANQYRGYYTRGYGYPCSQPEIFNLASTPLNEAIIAMMDIVPKFKRETGVQKVNTIFLTDGCSNGNREIYDLVFDKNQNTHYEGYRSFRSYNKNPSDIILTDTKTNKSYTLDSYYKITDQLLKILKDRVEGMNLVGFFIAGHGKSGRVDKRIIADLLNKSPWDVMDEVKFVNKNKFLAITSAGYDEYYILPGGNALQIENGGLSDELTGASKAKLKSAFGKSMKGKILSRQLLNKFVKLVA